MYIPKNCKLLVFKRRMCWVVSLIVWLTRSCDLTASILFLVSTTSDKQTASFKTVSTKRNPGWYKGDESLLVYETDNVRHSSRVYGFDMDGTIITTRSGESAPVFFFYLSAIVKSKKIFMYFTNKNIMTLFR